MSAPIGKSGKISGKSGSERRDDEESLALRERTRVLALPNAVQGHSAGVAADPSPPVLEPQSPPLPQLVSSSSSVPASFAAAYRSLLQFRGAPFVPPVADDQLRSIEAKLGRPLPVLLKTLWSIRNGDADPGTEDDLESAEPLFPSIEQFTRWIVTSNWNMIPEQLERMNALSTAEEIAESVASDRQVIESGRAAAMPCMLGRQFYRQYHYLPLSQWDEGSQGVMLDEMSGALIHFDIQRARPAGCWIKTRSITQALLEAIKQAAEQRDTSSSKRRKVAHKTCTATENKEEEAGSTQAAAPSPSSTSDSSSSASSSSASSASSSATAAASLDSMLAASSALQSELSHLSPLKNERAIVRRLVAAMIHITGVDFTCAPGYKAYPLNVDDEQLTDSALEQAGGGAARSHARQ